MSGQIVGKDGWGQTLWGVFLLQAVLIAGPLFAPQAALGQDLEAEKTQLENALAKTPGNLDILLRYGLLLSHMGDYAAALRAFDRGVSLDPKYIDFSIARARVLGYAGRVDEGLAEINVVLKSSSQNAEAYVVRGRLLYYRGDMKSAIAAFEDALRIDPVNAEAREGMASVQKTIRANADGGSWRLDLGTAQSDFGRVAQKPWYEHAVRLEHRFENDAGWSIQVRDARRYGQIDREYQGGARVKLTPTIETHVNLGTTPGANFLPQWHVEAGGSFKARNGHPGSVFRATVINFDARLRHYSNTSSIELKPGVTQYVFGGRGWVNVAWLNGQDTATGKRLPGWSARADWQSTDRIRIFTGYADAPEVDSAKKVDVKSRFVGLTLQVLPNLNATLALSQERRKQSYTRNEGSLSVSVEF